jgi:hypothetical protein
MNKSKQGHLKRLKEKKSKALDLYIHIIRVGAKLKVENKWKNKLLKLHDITWDFQRKWSDK